jgi:hypothetical protein
MKKILLTLLIICGIGAAYLLATQSPQISQQNQYTTQEVRQATVRAGTTTAPLEFTDGETLYQALVRAKEQNKIVFTAKEYPGLGFLVTDIGSLSPANGMYLMYYINGTEASTGVSSYTLKNGDIIEWKLQ